MVLPGRTRLPFAAALALCALAPLAPAADGLAGPSPFLPPSAQSDAAPTPDAQLELRGIMAAGETTMFSIYDPAHRTSVWTRVNEPGREFTLRSYDQSRDSVTVEYQGRMLTLALHTAKVASAPNVPLAPSPIAAPAGPPAIGGPVVLNPTPADEQRRLEAIAAEVNRRRMIRQQALQASRQAAGQAGAPNQVRTGNPNQTK